MSTLYVVLAGYPVLAVLFVRCGPVALADATLADATLADANLALPVAVAAVVLRAFLERGGQLAVTLLAKHTTKVP